jgi:hypothetical protein
MSRGSRSTPLKWVSISERRYWVSTRKMTDRMWPVIKGFIENLIYDGRDYLVEGVNLRPTTIAAFIKETDEPVKACFLGYPDVVIETKAAQVARHAGLPNDWLNRMGPDYVRRYLEISRSLSRHLRENCAALGIPFFDTGADFAGGLASAEFFLIRKDWLFQHS